MKRETKHISLASTIIAGILSWHVNHSVLWCMFHALCGWVYIGYYLIERFV